MRIFGGDDVIIKLSKRLSNTCNCYTI